MPKNNAPTASQGDTNTLTNELTAIRKDLSNFKEAVSQALCSHRVPKQSFEVRRNGMPSTWMTQCPRCWKVLNVEKLIRDGLWETDRNPSLYA